MTQTSERLHALDAVRGFALTLGVVFHATMAYLPGPQVWPVADTERSALLGVLFFTLHMARMTIFFVMAGFFGRLLMERRGTRGFALDRARRITLPMLVFWPILLAGIIGGSIYAAYVANGGALPPAPPPMPGPKPLLAVPLTHLWFLYLLTWFYLATLALRAVAARLKARGDAADKLVRAVATSALSPALVGAPLLAVFLADPKWLMWFGIKTPDYSLLPNLAAVVGYGVAFGFGWLLHRQPDLMRVWERRWPAHLAVAVLATAGALVLMGGPIGTPVLEVAPFGARKAAIAALYVIGAWSWVFGLIGAAVRFLNRESAWRRYLADASYWVYLIHLPIVIVLQAAVSRMDLPWPVKFLGVLAIAFPIMLGSYQVMVRYTWLGAILNGRRQPRPAKKSLHLRSAQA